MRTLCKMTTVVGLIAAGVLGAAGPHAHAKSVRVTNDLDSGPGSFRDAIEAANMDSKVNSIHFANNIGTVELSSTVTYSGEQLLTIDGRGATIQPDNGPFDLFVADGGGDLTLKRLTFQNGDNGIIVDVPSDAEGTVSVKLDDVVVQDNGLFGLRVRDSSASDAGLDVELSSSSFTGNGTAQLDQDGVRVEETGDGSIYTRVTRSRFDGNGADGLELDESDLGDAMLIALHSSFDQNGFQDIEEDPDDGLDIDEAGGGDIWVRLVNVSISNNEDEGADFDEEDGGSVDLSFTMVDANGNVDEGLKADEEDGGGIFGDLRNVQVDGTESQQGLQFEETDDGDVFVRIVNSSFTNNDDEGVQIEQVDDGEGEVRLQHVTFGGNGDGPTDFDGVDVIVVP